MISKGEINTHTAEIKKAVFCLKNTNGMKRNPSERSAVPTTMYKESDFQVVKSQQYRKRYRKATHFQNQALAMFFVKILT